MKKKIVSLLLATTMVVGMLAGCGKTEEPATSEEPAVEETSEAEEAEETAKKYEGVTINFWSMWNSTEPQAQGVLEAAEAFEKETGAVINVEFKGRDVRTVIQTELEAGGDVDMFETATDVIVPSCLDYILDLTEMAEAANYDEVSYDALRNAAIERAGGILPYVIEQPSVGGVFYNKDIFAECGITEKPVTWDEFLTVCQTLVDNGYQPLALDTAYASYNSGYHFERYLGEEKVKELAQNGGWGEVEGTVAAAQDIIDFVNAGYLADGAPDEFPASQNKMGLTQDVAMVVCGSFVCAEVNNNTGSELNWGLFNYPVIEEGTVGSAQAGSQGVAIAKNTKYPQACFDFALYFNSGEFDQNKANLASQIPADPSNAAPAILADTVEVLSSIEKPMSWSAGILNNAELSTAINDWTIQLWSGTYATGEEAINALDALY